jgi:hypothetical protein
VIRYVPIEGSDGGGGEVRVRDSANGDSSSSSGTVLMLRRG